MIALSLISFAQRLLRARTFKVYLIIPSIRAALFGAASGEDDAMGNLAETALLSQWLHSAEISGSLHYARWKAGRRDSEVDIVSMDPRAQGPHFAVEITWSDRIVDHPEELPGAVELATKFPLERPVVVTTRTRRSKASIRGIEIDFVPAALYCHSIAKDIPS